jgi:hypothetical protein
MAAGVEIEMLGWRPRVAKGSAASLRLGWVHEVRAYGRLIDSCGPAVGALQAMVDSSVRDVGAGSSAVSIGSGMLGSRR